MQVSHCEMQYLIQVSHGAQYWPLECGELWCWQVVWCWDAASDLYSATPTATTAASRTFIGTISIRYANEFIQQQYI